MPMPPLTFVECFILLVMNWVSLYNIHLYFCSCNCFPSTASGRQQLENPSRHQKGNTMTIISTEGTKNDFSLVSDYECTATAKKKTRYTTPGSTLPPTSSDESKPDFRKLETSEITDDQATVSESNCICELDNLSLSDKTTHGIHRSNGQVHESVLVPALFVFGGVDTQETVHGDSFVLVPK